MKGGGSKGGREGGRKREGGERRKKGRKTLFSRPKRQVLSP